MNIRRLMDLVGDVARVNRSFLTSEGERARIRRALRSGDFDRRMEALIDADVAAAPQTALPYARLSSGSLALSGIAFGADRPRLNLVIGEVHPARVFAGVHTALNAAAELASALGLGLRVVMLDATAPGNSPASVTAYLADALHITDVEVVARETVRAARFAARDLWLASHSKTAHALQVACDAGVIDRTRVGYLIQDYEPGFSPWSTESELARATYHAGFHPIVNSAPLATYLRRTEHLDIPEQFVFAPRFEEAQLRGAAAERVAHERVRVLFYGRRSKPRNLFALGVSALRATARDLGASVGSVEFVSAGEKHHPIDLGNGATLSSRGRIAWNDYFSFLSTVDVALSLQMSPHPSHPPFDAAISGAWAVTNDFDGVRTGLHPRIAAVAPTTKALSAAIAEAIAASRDAEPAPYLPVADGVLGREWSAVVESVAERLGSVQDA